MIKDKCNDFIDFLCNFLDDDTITKWLDDPNNAEILTEIANYGYDFYNHVYVGNEGYEWIEEYI